MAAGTCNSLPLLLKRFWVRMKLVVLKMNIRAA